MARILLVHGSCHGAWCWDLVLPRLRALGHDVEAIDLPGRLPDDPDPTLDDHARSISDACPEPTVLVGHSAGGYPITAAAEAGASVSRLIYLCAYVPRAGLGLADMRRLWPEQPLVPSIRLSEDRQRFTIDPGMVRHHFYADVPAPLAKDAAARLCPEPVVPQLTPLPATTRAEALPRRYIVCRQDNAIPPDFQREMSADWPRAHVTELDTSHSPFLSAPDRLAALLDRMATD
ncbi:alpha/beta fold hydrolase [Pelagovum pacificum]|uniref:Alpha/beta fold hydrolase n=1 Tax=Pelagovum pacificum TaxID=2588711 RepID=A0A5C5GGN7_9RHOB|nr:alpha/beta fold hydrolase [Pelagovum pacificum]QQA43479.1 alpha/beta fold hydrolase [Pelagovum pacificum]TNY33384.1 alpha/beta fold hydrolase [Pelagovum pacificum]